MSIRRGPSWLEMLTRVFLEQSSSLFPDVPCRGYMDKGKSPECSRLIWITYSECVWWEVTDMSHWWVWCGAGVSQGGARMGSLWQLHFNWQLASLWPQQLGLWRRPHSGQRKVGGGNPFLQHLKVQSTFHYRILPELSFGECYKAKECLPWMPLYYQTIVATDKKKFQTRSTRLIKLN